MNRSVLALLAIGICAVGCRDEGATGVEFEARFAKAGPPGVGAHYADSRANLVWDDLVDLGGTPEAAGIRGDGRNREGLSTPSANEYQGDYCGVRGLIYDRRGENGTIDFDPDTNYDGSTMQSACGPARYLRFFPGDGQSIGSTEVVATPHIRVDGAWYMGVDESRLQPMTFGMQEVTCMLVFDDQYAGSSNVFVSRLADGTDSNGDAVARWLVRSQGSHVAACIVPGKNGRRVDTGARYYLPFSFRVTQVRQPAPAYP